MATEDQENLSNWENLSARLVAALKPFDNPVAITFLAENNQSSPKRREESYPAPNERGRTGQVPAGCVFWIHGAQDTFSTTAADHANCSVGSFTHGFMTLEEAAGKDDVEAVLEAGWVDEAAVTTLPHVKATPESVVYGPLLECRSAPDVVLMRINGLGLMTLKDAVPELIIEGKPQCHIVALAKEQQLVAASTGCALSRSRTGMRSEEMTCVIPGNRLNEIVESIESTVALNRQMASYASSDAKRFSA